MTQAQAVSVGCHHLVYRLTPLRIRFLYAITRNHPQLLDLQPQDNRRRIARVGVATGAACARRPRHTDASVGTDVPGCIALGNEDVEAAARAVVVRRVGEERLQAVAAPMGVRKPRAYRLSRATRN